MMNGRFLSQEIISDFKEHLILEERSAATVEKYIRDVKSFAAFVKNAEVTKEKVIEQDCVTACLYQCMSKLGASAHLFTK